MTDADAKEIIEKLDLILDALGLGIKDIITPSQAKDSARKMVLQFRKKNPSMRHEREEGR
jgi:hypothetical protein